MILLLALVSGGDGGELNSARAYFDMACSLLRLAPVAALGFYFFNTV
jgi:hypothetical protein